MVEILNGDTCLAYNDDYVLEGLAPTDAAVVGLPLETAGRYTIRVNSFNGATVGEVEVTLTVVDALPTETVSETTLLVPLRTDSLYTVPLDAGETYKITARDVDGILDPVLTIRDENGHVTERNDDHDSDDLTLNIFDAQLTLFTVPADGSYLLELSEFMGREGVIELTIEAI